jgi:hypothetical protein
MDASIRGEGRPMVTSFGTSVEFFDLSIELFNNKLILDCDL